MFLLNLTTIQLIRHLASTHNDTLMALVDEIWNMGAKSISLGERSYPPTQEVMDKKGYSSSVKAEGCSYY